MEKLESTLTENQKRTILKNYGEIPIREIASLTGLKSRSITKFISNRGLKLSKEQRANLMYGKYTKYDRDDNYFKSKSNDSIYWAGFIAADGYVIGSRLRIKLKYTDKSHLEKIKKVLGYTGPIKKDCSERLGKVHCGALLYISSKQIVDNLLELYNIGEKKSLTLKPPKLKGTEADLFILGLFDGDGTVYQKGKYKCVRFYGTKEINEWVKRRINEIYPKNSGSVFKKGNIYCFELNPGASDFFMKHYGNLESPRLERKWNKN